MERREITREQAESAIRQGEFGETVRCAARNVAVVLSQDWCRQWVEMDRYLGTLEDPRLAVFQLVYNRVDYFREFMRFKEEVLGNDQIPYVRYYRDGRLIGWSNFVSSRQFLAHFGD